MLGDQIRRIRKAEGLTVCALAKKTGVSESYISQLERGLADPSVSLLRRIAGVLQVSVASFFDEEGEAPILTRREEREQTVTEDGSASFSQISPASEALRLQMVEMTLRPGAQLNGETGGHYTSLFLTAGSLRISYLDTVSEMECGDSVFLPSHTAYTLSCTSRAAAVGILCTAKEGAQA